MTRRSPAAHAGFAFVVGLLVCVFAGHGRAQSTPPRQAPAPAAARARSGSPALVPDARKLAAAPPELRGRLAADAFNYFRFVNVPWARRVCAAFADDVSWLPMVRLHGDAHVEQYAYTSTARGLDDFDDSASGPAVIDLVRFLGSLDLAARARGWQGSDGLLFDRFLAGYREGVANRDYLPPEPGIVRRLRPTSTREPRAFLAWADSLMQPLEADDLVRTAAAFRRLDRLLRSAEPSLPPGYLALQKAGWLTMGVGSALTRKMLARVAGPSPSPDDDVIIEAKPLSDLRGVRCLSEPGAGEVFRVITGIEDIGRIHHDILAVVPRPPLGTPALFNSWVRSWDPSYAEVTVRDYASVEELVEVAHDAGAQLGVGSLRESGVAVERQKRQLQLDALASLEPRIRSVAMQLASELVEEWTRFKAGATAGR